MSLYYGKIIFTVAFFFSTMSYKAILYKTGKTILLK